MNRMAAVLACALAVAVPACNEDDKDLDAGRKDRGFGDGPRPDGPACRRPPDINSCIAPGTDVCPTKVLCLGCECSGVMPVYACNGLTHDCRWFCTGCYPADYTACDQRAPKAILGLCGYCLADGGPPGKCSVAFREAGVLDFGKTDQSKADLVGDKGKQ